MAKIEIICQNCTNKNIVKSGFSRNRTQLYKCNDCLKRFQINYKYNAYNLDLEERITTCMHSGVGVRATGKVLKIAYNTVLNFLKKTKKSEN
jgi:transposase-like protein